MKMGAKREFSRMSKKQGKKTSRVKGRANSKIGNGMAMKDKERMKLWEIE